MADSTKTKSDTTKVDWEAIRRELIESGVNLDEFDEDFDEFGATATDGPTFTDEISATVAAPGLRAWKGLYQLFPKDRTANPVAGLGNVALAAVETAALPIAVPLAATRQVPLVGDVQKGLEAVLSGLGDFFAQHAAAASRGIAETVGYSPESAGEIADVARDVVSSGMQGLALGGTVGAIRARGRLVPEALPARVMESALQPSISKPITAQKQVEAALDYGARVSTKSIGENAMRMKELQSEIGRIIQSGAKRGDMLDVEQMLSGLRNLRNSYMRRSAPEEALRDIDEVAERIRTHPLVREGKLPVDVVQEIKKDLYNRNKYGDAQTQIMRSDAYRNTEKAIAATAKRLLENLYPELRNLNEEYGARIELDRALTKAVGRARNRNIVPFGPLVAGSAAGAVTSNVTTGGMAALLKFILDQPYMKSALAVALRRARDKALRAKAVAAPVSTRVAQATGFALPKDQIQQENDY